MQIPFVRLDAAGTTLMLDLRHGEASILYFGSALQAATTPESVAESVIRTIPPNAPSIEPRITLTPLMAAGYVGAPGLALHRDGASFAPLPRLTEIAVEGTSITLRSVDAAAALELIHTLTLDADTGVLRCAAQIINRHRETCTLDHLAAPAIPLPVWASDHIGFSGRWAGEFMTLRAPILTGAMVRENRRGRTSHDCFPGAMLASADASERQGEVMALHLAWSGNHAHRIERLADGRGAVQFGELLLPGEVRLAQDEGYTTPTLVVAVGDRGFNAVSQRLHRFVRTAIVDSCVTTRPRPVHYNSWEAIYFDHDPAVLDDLATRAAALGVERFVLDDGWFGARRSDRAGLGDWWVSEEVYPDGLKPLIDRVRALGMEFGLWVEPEMVNPDSDLFRAHPDWVLSLPGVAQLPSRHQYVLDLSNAAVTEYLFDRIDALLRSYPIGYLKWDMNRDINHPGNSDGHASVHGQVKALYALIDRIRVAHPGVEIESCASGGGRADYAILERTQRLWTSDSNDAIDRLRIQRGASYFFPCAVLGAHVGPRDCHITGRRLSMAMRAGVALFGHMGLEMDLRELTDAEASELAAAIALHKQHRALIHGGNRVRIDTPPERDAFGIVAADQSEALFSYALLEGHPATLPGRLRFDGLDPARRYRMSQPWPARAAADPREVMGDALMLAGIELPLLWPQSVMIWHLKAV
ncbi:MAG: alpha-galactosidase [Novosphingobium sp.]